MRHAPNATGKKKKSGVEKREVLQALDWSLAEGGAMRHPKNKGGDAAIISELFVIFVGLYFFF